MCKNVNCTTRYGKSRQWYSAWYGQNPFCVEPIPVDNLLFCNSRLSLLLGFSLYTTHCCIGFPYITALHVCLPSFTLSLGNLHPPKKAVERFGKEQRGLVMVAVRVLSLACTANVCDPVCVNILLGQDV